MSHPFAPFRNHGPTLLLEHTRQWAIRAALDSCAAGQYATAAHELESARDTARALAGMVQDRDAAAEAHMLAAADQADTWATEAWNAAHAHQAPITSIHPTGAAHAA